jgi:hypothetical protein
MLRRGLSAALVMFVVGGFLLAGTHRGVITKIEDGKVTMKTFKKGDKEGTDKTFKISKDAKFIIKAKDKDGEDKEVKLEDVKERLAKAKESKRGRGAAFATVETTGDGDDETITKITFGGRGKGGKKKKDE